MTLSSVVTLLGGIGGFSRLLTRMVPGAGSELAVHHLEPAGAPVALEAAWQAILEVARGPVDATRRSFAGEPATYEAPVESVRQIERFLESLPLETIDLATIGPRLVHLTQLNEDLTRAAPPRRRSPPGSRPQRIRTHHPIPRSTRPSRSPRTRSPPTAKPAASRPSPHYTRTRLPGHLIW